MMKSVQKFIEDNVHLIETNNFRELFLKAYDDSLMTTEVQELHKILLDAEIYDSTSLRNDLLYEKISERLVFIRLRHPNDLNTANMSLAETHVIQFLRRYLNNTFGFSESEAVEFMIYNQNILDIKLKKSAAMGAGNSSNYHIEYV